MALSRASSALSNGIVAAADSLSHSQGSNRFHAVNRNTEIWGPISWVDGIGQADTDSVSFWERHFMISPNWTIGVSMDPTTVVGILHVTPVEADYGHLGSILKHPNWQLHRIRRCRDARALPDGDWKSEQARSGVAPLVKARFPCGDWRRCRGRRIASHVRNGLKLERRWKPRRKRSTMPGPDEDQLSGADPTRRCGAWHAQRRNR
jgi:hypothetical protein